MIEINFVRSLPYYFPAMQTRTSKKSRCGGDYRADWDKKGELWQMVRVVYKGRKVGSQSTVATLIHELAHACYPREFTEQIRKRIDRRLRRAKLLKAGTLAGVDAKGIKNYKDYLQPEEHYVRAFTGLVLSNSLITPQPFKQIIQFMKGVILENKPRQSRLGKKYLNRTLKVLEKCLA